MKVLLIAPPWLPVPPPGYGGTEAVLDGLARGLRATGHDVVLFTTGDSTCDVPMQWVRTDAAGIDACNPGVELEHVVHAYRFAQEWGADVVHDHTVVGALYGSHLRVPLVATNHGPFEGVFGDSYRALADVIPVVALSADHARRAAPAPVAAVIHHGIDIDAPVRTTRDGGDGAYVAFLGRMSPDKGVVAAARIARAAAVPLRIAGKRREPAERAYFDRDVAPLLEQGVEYVGEVGGADKREFLTAARCLLNPIAWPEPFGMVMIEALACGTPVVATPCGSVREIVTDGVTGYVRESECELARAIDLVDGIERGRCRLEAEERFSSRRMVEQHVDLYERVARHSAAQVDASRSSAVGASRPRRNSATSVPISASHDLRAALE